MLSASTSMPCSSITRMRSAAFDMSSTFGKFGWPFTLSPMRAMASGTWQCAWTSTVFTRLPFTTTSRRRVCASTSPDPPEIEHATKATPPTVVFSMKALRVMASSWTSARRLE